MPKHKQIRYIKYGILHFLHLFLIIEVFHNISHQYSIKDEDLTALGIKQALEVREKINNFSEDTLNGYAWILTIAKNLSINENKNQTAIRLECRLIFSISVFISNRNRSYCCYHRSSNR